MAKAKAKAKAKRAPKAKAKRAKKPRSPAQKAATARMLAARAAKKAAGAKASAKPRKGAKRAPRAQGVPSAMVTRVEALERRVDNHSAVLSDLVAVVEGHDARLNAIDAAFGMGAGAGASARGNRTVEMPAFPGGN